MEIFIKILHSYAIYCLKEMVKILKCYLILQKSYDTLSKGAIFLANPVYFDTLPTKLSTLRGLLVLLNS